jgi:hypothetical protein
MFVNADMIGGRFASAEPGSSGAGVEMAAARQALRGIPSLTAIASRSWWKRIWPAVAGLAHRPKA